MRGAIATELRDTVLPDGRTIRARLTPGAGAPIVALHGLFDSSVGWAALAGGTHRPVLAIDLPGFGGSCAPTAGRIDALAADVAAAIDAAGLRSFTLVGHSLGGAVAARVAELRAAETAALVLIAPACFGPILVAQGAALPVVRELLAGMLPFALSHRGLVGMGYRAFVGNGTPPTEELIARLAASAAVCRAGARAAVQAIAHAPGDPAWLARRGSTYDGPVVALWGARDALVPIGHAAGVRRAFPHAELHVWEGMGHHPLRERQTETVALIERAAAAARRERRTRRRTAHRRRLQQLAPAA